MVVKMTNENKITYEEMSQIIADDWNKEGKEQVTWEQIWKALGKTSFPALWGGMMYDAAKTGNLVGLLLTDNTCAKIFWHILEENKNNYVS